MKSWTILLLVFFIPEVVFCTAQAPDELSYKGGVHQVHYFRLSDELELNLKLYKQKNKDTFYIISANWDGVYFNLEIRNKKLHVLNVSFDCDPNVCPSVKEVIGISIPESGLFANWFSGEIIEYFGEPYFAHTSSHSRVFKFNQGILIEVEEKLSEGYESAK